MTLATRAAVYALAFPEQARFLRSPARKKSLLCPRRAGKSEAGAIYLVFAALAYEGARCLYIGLTLGTAKRIMWGKLKDICQKAGVQHVANETELTLRFPNGSSIRLMGLDAHEGMAARVLGDHYKLIVLDEAASFRIDLEALIKTYLEPATMDQQGTIAMTGTPDPDEALGFFYEVTEGKVDGWERHTWSTTANTAKPPGASMRICDSYAAKLAELAETDPDYLLTDEARCMYFGEWPREHKGRVYLFDRAKNLVGEPPEDIYARVIGVDLGWTDDTAIVEVGWKHGDPTLYVLGAEKCPHMLLDEISDRIKRRIQRLKTHTRVVVDGANQQVVQELRRRYGLPLENAEKSEKVSNIRMLNTDMQRGRIQVVRGVATDLVAEWTGADEDGREVKGATPLIWDARAAQARPPRKVEDPRCNNHCLVAGTMVATAHGPRPLESVKVGEDVWTRAGLRRVKNAGQTGLEPTWVLETEAGRRIEGTANHPVFTDELGWVALENLTQGLTLTAWESGSTSTGKASTSSTTASSTTDTPSQSAGRCGCTGSQARARSCTVYCTKRRTAPSQPACSCTTSTGTLSTTRWTTSSSSPQPSTQPSTGPLSEQIAAEPSSRRFARWLRSGIARRLAALGIGSTPRLSPPALSCTHVSAPSARADSSPSAGQPRCAGARATQPSVEGRGSTTCAGCAPSVGLSSPATSTPAMSTARDRVRRVWSTGAVSPVYNLHVDGDEEYFANGILTHNCSDSLLYAFRASSAFREALGIPKPPPGTDAAMSLQLAERRKRIERERQKQARRESRR